MEEITKDTVELMTFDVVKFDITRAEISEIAQRGMALSIKGLDDKTGFDAVHSALMDVVHRCAFIEKQGLAYRRKALDWNKAVLVEEKDLLGLFRPVRDYLTDQKQRVVDENTRIKAEAEAKIQAIFQAKENRLLDMGCRFDRIAMAYSYGEIIVPVATVKVDPDDAWEKIAAAIQEAVDVDKAKAAEEADRITNESRKLAIRSKLQSLHEVYVTPSMTSTEIESLAESYKNNIPGEDFQEFAEEALQIYQKTLSSLCKMHGERVEQEHITAEQAKERERLAAEGKSIREAAEALAREKKAAEDAILKAEQDKQRAAEMEKAKTEAAEKARIETEARIKREDEEKIAREKAEAEAKTAREEKARIAAEKKAARAPDKVKILLVADMLDAIQTPDVKTEDGKAVALAVMMSIAELIKSIRDKAEEL